MCALETRTNFFPFKKSPKPGCVLNSGAYYIREYTVITFHITMDPVSISFLPKSSTPDLYVLQDGKASGCVTGELDGHGRLPVLLSNF